MSGIDTTKLVFANLIKSLCSPDIPSATCNPCHMATATLASLISASKESLPKPSEDVTQRVIGIVNSKPMEKSIINKEGI